MTTQKVLGQTPKVKNIYNFQQNWKLWKKYRYKINLKGTFYYIVPRRKKKKPTLWLVRKKNIKVSAKKEQQWQNSWKKIVIHFHTFKFHKNQMKSKEN